MKTMRPGMYINFAQRGVVWLESCPCCGVALKGDCCERCDEVENATTAYPSRKRTRSFNSKRV